MSRRLQPVTLSVAIVALLCLPGCKEKPPAPKAEVPDAGWPDAEPPLPQPRAPVLAAVKGASVANGKTIFLRDCAGCHGQDAKGQGLKAKELRLAPTNLTTIDYLCRTTKGIPVSVPSDTDIEQATLRGTHRSDKTVSKLSAQSRRSLTLYLKTLHREFSRAPQPLSWVPAEPTADAEAAKRGRTLYLAFGCWQCHGMSGAGNGAAVKTMRWNGQPVRSLTPLYRHDDFICGDDAEMVFRRIDLGMGGTIMPPYREFLAFMRRPGKGRPEDWTLSLIGKASAEEIKDVQAFYQSLPERKKLIAMSKNTRHKRAAAFIWDLTHYVLALEQPPKKKTPPSP